MNSVTFKIRDLKSRHNWSSSGSIGKRAHKLPALGAYWAYWLPYLGHVTEVDQHIRRIVS